MPLQGFRGLEEVKGTALESKLCFLWDLRKLSTYLDLENGGRSGGKGTNARKHFLFCQCFSKKIKSIKSVQQNCSSILSDDKIDQICLDTNINELDE